MRVLGYGAEFAKVSEIGEVYNFFPELYSWGRHDAFFFRLRELREDTPISISQVSAMIPIVELRESEWHYEGPEWEFFPWREEIRSILRFYAIVQLPGICVALYRQYPTGDGDEGMNYLLEYRSRDMEEWEPLVRLRLKETDYVKMFETAQIEFFIYAAFREGWRIKFI